ncbi:DEAD/DEAH box helicase [Rhodoblastus sp. 17X3]|uniref:ATP-dependent DNA helicase n=1 Tax=Rhodoblastus sp. 17X3 TaxID=3047026 RepID=UPI0024B6C10C|nr:DEAD/DEAH box helicase [Rhodoblastus sp. 17X3]MDI9846735.1 DEAD/DEAH box helicase [Rhodoblastus sp. 17X3]
MAAHNGSVSAAQAENLIEDAWSLASWFCRRMRPDVAWTIADAGTVATVSRSPNLRNVRIQDDVTATEPSVCSPRTRIRLREAFEADLTEDQERCIEALEAFLADDRGRIFLLKGYAGTGKTFLAAGLTEYLLTQGRDFSLAAPTGRAAKAIGSKTGQPARTLHSLIYTYSDMTEHADDEADEASTFKMIAKVAQNDHPINAVYIVDEASLISNIEAESEFFRSGSGFLLQDLIAYVGSAHSGNARKIIFIGDPAQLPPVNMPYSPALDGDYLLQTFGLVSASYELTEIVRQKAGSAVLRNVMPLRECLAAGSFSSLAFTYDDDVIRLDRDRVTDLYMRIREGRGPQAPIIVTHSNAEAAEFSRAIRARLFPGRNYVAAGDTVIVIANGFCATHYIANGEILRIESVEPVVESRSVQLKQKLGDTKVVEIVNVVMRFRDVIVAMPQPDGEDLMLSTKILDDVLHGDGAGLDPLQQRALYVDFVRRHKHIDRKRDRDEFRLAMRSDPYFTALRLRFGYAVTCHKAQGGEWSHVIASCATNRNPRSADYFRWLYTAMTRTSAKLYLVDPPDIKTKPPSDPAGDWVTPDETAAQVAQNPAPAPAPVKEAEALATLSPQAMCRQWLESEIGARLSGTGVEIEDIAHYPYREAYFVKRDAETARIDITYKGDWKVSCVSSPRPSAFAESVVERIVPIVGLRPTGLPPRAGAVSEPRLPFLRKYHVRLVAALARRSVSVAELREQDFALRYRLARGSDTVDVNIFYNGRDQITNFRPVNPAPNPGPTLVALQNDVRAVLAEVSP